MDQILLFLIKIANAADPLTTGGGSIPVVIKNPLVVDTVQELLKRIANYMFGFGVAISVIMVLYGAFQILTAGKGGSYEKGLSTIKYAALGLAIMMLAYGFASLIANILGLKSGNGLNPPVPRESTFSPPLQRFAPSPLPTRDAPQ